MMKRMIYNLSPFNNETNMSAVEFATKKILAFALIYGISAVLGEAIIIGILLAMGYDPLHGIMPGGQMDELLLYDGFLIFSLVTLLYWRVVEKKDMKSIGFSGNPIGYFLGALIAISLLAVITGICCVTHSIKFGGFSTNASIKNLLLWMAAFVIQGAAEEIMCRGFLLNSLKHRLSMPWAIAISSSVFAFLHILNTNLMDAHFVYAIIGILNLYLISIVFSMLVFWNTNIWSACGLHSAWNFILYGIMGLSLSGNESMANGVILFQVTDATLQNGGAYGIEASCITTLVLGIFLFIMAKGWKGRRSKNGI